MLLLITKVNSFQIILKNPELQFQINEFKYSEVKYQFVTRMDSILQFWEYIRESLKLVFHLDQFRYFLSFQVSFYGRSKFQPLSGKHTRHLVLEVLNKFIIHALT